MAQEIEAKIINIDVKKLEKKLKAVGAVKVCDTFFRSISFDVEGYGLDDKAAWVRLRDSGKEVTLAYKQRLGVSDMHGTRDAGMEEVEVVVSSYEDTVEILKKIGMIAKFSQEKKRTTWKKGGVTFDIDTWPRLDPYLEIEAGSWEEVDAAIIELGYKLEDKLVCSTTQIYRLKGINDKEFIHMPFGEWIKRDGTIV